MSHPPNARSDEPATLLLDTASPRAPGALPPSRIGPYQLQELLGAGGMGEVYRAEQAHPVAREVALKTMPGRGDPLLDAQFEIERHALARMTHPSIAQLYDAGTAADGRLYFAMELVRGQPIDCYCAAERLDLGQRLALFQKVCHAVQHAHDRGLVHRDLKPTNILVTRVDGVALPKLIDFGIAAAAGVARARHAGTQLYMSPEALADDAPVDTRSDVYALGVVLAEITTGLPPALIANRVARLGQSARLVLIDGETHEPAAERAAFARTIGLSPSQLAALVHGELGWMLERALKPDRDQRYASPQALADDIGRLLRHQPIDAHPPSARYRARKLMRRHRVPVAATAMLLLGGVVAFAITFAALKQASAGRDLAQAAEREAARQARIAASVNRFLTDDLLGSANIEERPNADRLTVRELVVDAGAALGADHDLEPEAEADIRYALGRTLASLGRPSDAEVEFAAAARQRSALFGDNDPRTLAAQVARADADTSEARYAESRAELERLVARIRRDAPDDATLLANATIALVRTLAFGGEYAQAIALIQPLASAPADAPRHADAELLLAWVLSRTGEHERALAIFDRYIDKRAADFGHDSWPWLMAMGSKASALHRASRFNEAVAIRAQIVAAIGARFPEHAEFGQQLSHLAAHRVAVGDFAAAERDARAAIEALERSFPDGHSVLGNAYSHLGAALAGSGHDAEARVAFEHARAIYLRTLTEAHPLYRQNEQRIAAQTGADGSN